MKARVSSVLVASGGGTDANAIMEAYNSGFIPNICLEALISTKRDAACLKRAEEQNIRAIIIDRKEADSETEFNRRLSAYLEALECQLIFLVGCVVKIYPIPGIKIYNIHPAAINKFGGQKMYGLKVHEAVLQNIRESIEQGASAPDDRFFTYPTVHEAVEEFDSGPTLLRASVEIPRSIIKNWLEERTTLTEAAERLQKYVLPYEWLILPTAVRMAAQQIIDAG